MSVALPRCAAVYRHATRVQCCMAVHRDAWLNVMFLVTLNHNIVIHSTQGACHCFRRDL